MYDNVDFYVRSEDVSGIDFLGETPCNFDVTGEHDFNGEHVISGTVGDVPNKNYFKIATSRRGVAIKDGSLCKWYLGDNFQTLGRGDTRRAIEKLGDTLHLPIDEATVTRLDVAQNFIVQHPVQVYYNHLGELKYAGRAPIIGNRETEGLYYHQSRGLLVFYDKVREQTGKGRPIPELYQGKNVLRYEQRYKSRLSKSFNVERVTGAMLCKERFYMEVINRWAENYKNIEKINDTNINFEAMKTKRDLYTMGILALIEMQGGELAMLGQINEAYKSGQLTRRQADDLKAVTREACKVKEGITTKNEAILELDRKVRDAVKYYR
jgi:hypothetical protein